MSKVKQRLLQGLKFSLYPLFYLTCLLTFFYLTFPWDRLRDRIVAEFDAAQDSKEGAPQRLEIGEISGYWITGVELENIRLIVPPTRAEITAAEQEARRIANGEEDPEDAAEAADDEDEDADGEGAKKPKAKEAAAAKKPKADPTPRDTIVVVERATARVQILPLLVGRVQVAFDVEAFGGDITGSVPVKGKGDIELALENVDLGQIPVLKRYLTVPLRGVATGELTLTRGEGGKLAKSVGSLALSIEDAIVGDGKTKFAGLISLPAAKLGKVEVAAAAEAGILKLSKFGAEGGDLELSAQGQVRLREKWRGSALDFFLRFKFSDGYRNKDDKTKLLFGVPGSKIPGIIDTQPKIKRAKRGDDSYGLHVYGSLRAPKYEPWTTDEAVSASKRKDAKAKTTADDDDEDDDGDEPDGSSVKRGKTRTPRSTISGKTIGGGKRASPTIEPPSVEPPIEEPVREEMPKRAEPMPPPPPLLDVEPPPLDVVNEPLLEEAPPGDAALDDGAGPPPEEEAPAP